MSEERIERIEVGKIVPSPFQHRRAFSESDLKELARSIETDGLIQPITVRPVNAHFELIAGERRWRSVKEFTALSSISARILNVGDNQARRLCATENLQRSDLSAIEEVSALVDIIDTELLDAFEEYSGFGGTSVERVRFVLMKLDSDRRTGTDYFSHKFMGKVEAVFSGLPKPKDWRSLYNNDLPLLTSIDDDVQEISVNEKLNKSQTKAIQKLKDADKSAFAVAAGTGDGIMRHVSRNCGLSDLDAEPDKPEKLRDLSADRIAKAAKHIAAPQLSSSVLATKFTGDPEGYTPRQYIDAAREVMGSIDLDPASNPYAQKTVQAETYYTKEDDGLSKPWSGNVFLNPPYCHPEIKQFINKLIAHYSAGDIDQAILLTNNNTDTVWFHESAFIASAICLTKGRINFYKPDGSETQPVNGQAFFYFGGNVEKFKAHFSGIGLVVSRI